MQLADGRKSLQEIRDEKAQSVARLRARNSLHYSSEEIETLDSEAASALLFPSPKKVASEVSRLTDAYSMVSPDAAESFRAALLTTRPDRDRLIDALAASDTATRGAAIVALTTGSRQSQFEAVRSAVADLYRLLAKAGR